MSGRGRGRLDDSRVDYAYEPKSFFAKAKTRRVDVTTEDVDDLTSFVEQTFGESGPGRQFLAIFSVLADFYVDARSSDRDDCHASAIQAAERPVRYWLDNCVNSDFCTLNRIVRTVAEKCHVPPKVRLEAAAEAVSSARKCAGCNVKFVPGELAI
eukprot:4249145-Prymnesium_polylepis.1